MVSKVIKSDDMCVYTESKKRATSALNNTEDQSRPAANISECSLTLVELLERPKSAHKTL